MKTIVISIDPRRDLREGGYSTEEAPSMIRAWRQAVQAAAKELSIDVETFSTTYDSPEEWERATQTEIGDGETLEAAIWQHGHDSIVRADDGTWSHESCPLGDHLYAAVDRLSSGAT